MPDLGATTTDKVETTGGAPDASSTPASTTPAAPATALDALKGADSRLNQPDSSSGTPAATTTPPPVAQPASDAAPAESEGIRQLRSAYEDLKTKTGWAANLNHNEVREAMQFFADFTRNPIAVIREIMSDPDLGAVVGGMLRPPAEDLEPQPDLQTSDGAHKVYSATQLAKWREWNNRQQTAALNKELGPIKDFVSSSQETQQRTEIAQAAARTTTRVMAEMREMPHFKDHEPEIEKRLRAIPPHVRREIGAIGCLQMAYNQTLKEVVFPKIEADADKRADERARQKAAAGAGGIKPNGGAGSTTVKRPTNQAELAEHMRKLANSQA